MQLKKLHSLILKAFLPPFFATLFTTSFLFFLVELVITYLDEFIGKGISTLNFAKLFTYAWVALTPKCIPLAVLLASIMTFGKLAENYELAAMKSSGLSLFKIIKPAFAFILVLAFFTFLFENYVLPVVQLKFESLLFDIRQKKPSVSIKEGIFYNKIENYTIRVGSKSTNKDTLKQVYIYDHTSRMGNIIQLYADKGRMTFTADSSDLVLILENGNRYEEIINTSPTTIKKKTLSQLNFKTLKINVPLLNFKFRRTDENSFKGYEKLLNIWQIDSENDSMKKLISIRATDLKRQTGDYFFSRTNNNIRLNKLYSNFDKLYDSLKLQEQKRLLDNALNILRSNSVYVDGVVQSQEMDDTKIRAFNVEWHHKIIVCFACIILFFVGAPLGAIIRKGGLGLPVVVAVFFFLAYFILTDAFTALAMNGEWVVWQAMWMPLAIFMPLSIFLTYKASNDSVLFDVTAYFLWFKKLNLFK
ncbi:MAG: LptF/LptG family permease [Bacteroidetes bacterium]|nr:LptF/LptG family permease [Bacteroidota bacterium]